MIQKEILAAGKGLKVGRTLQMIGVVQVEGPEVFQAGNAENAAIVEIAVAGVVEAGKVESGLQKLDYLVGTD